MNRKRNQSLARLKTLEAVAKGENGEGRKRRSLALAELRSELRALLRSLDAYESETLVLYVPLPKLRPFHAFGGTWRVVDGSNQSGKTLAAAVEIARAVTVSDPFNKYPQRDGTVLAVGLNIPHLGDPMYRKIALPGAISMIDDEVTGLPRLVRPDPTDQTRLDPYDAAYREKWRDAPPLIPPRLIQSCSFFNKAKQQPELLMLKTGWTIAWRASTGKPAQGIQIDLGWIDEHIENVDHYYELTRGLMRRNGRGIWSATQQVLNDQLENLRKRYEAGDSRVLAIRLLIAENPYIPPEAKQEFFDSLPEEERRVRWYGEAAIVTRRVYSEFSVEWHTCDPIDVPATWTRYCVVDPGTQRCGTLIAAVPPAGSPVYILESATLHNSNAVRWAEWVQQRSSDAWEWEAFIIDQRMGRQTGAGYGVSVADHYFSALKDAGVSVRARGELSGFFAGCDDIATREESLKLWFAKPQEGEIPKVQIFRGACQELERQIESAVTTLRDTNKRHKQANDELQCLEYLAAFQPYYYKPPTIHEKVSNPVWESFLAKQTRKTRAHRYAF